MTELVWEKVTIEKGIMGKMLLRNVKMGALYVRSNFMQLKLKFYRR
jgi:hypothetical protein